MLVDIGNVTGTDKVGHGFLPFYDSFMTPFKDEPIRFLEIGVFYGASIKMWASYFTHPEAEIVGADWFTGVQGNSHVFSNPRSVFAQELDKRIKLVELNQADVDELVKFKQAQGNFDFILDDGSHLMKDQQQTFGILFDSLKPGGYFIIEDLHTSFSTGYDVCSDEMTTYKMVELLKNKQLPNLTHYNLTQDIVNQIDSVVIEDVKPGSITCYIKKKSD